MKNRQHYYMQNRDCKLPAVHFRKENETKALCENRKGFLLETRSEKVTCKNCLKRMKEEKTK